MPGKNKNKKKEEKRTCGYKLHGDKICGRPLYDNEHCIFHSREIERKKGKFLEEFWHEFKREEKDGGIAISGNGKFDINCYNFIGFIFPVDITFKGKKFNKDVFFNASRFLGQVDFSDSYFEGKAIFDDCTFGSYSCFEKTSFGGEARIKAIFENISSFRGAIFNDNAIFINAKFKGGTDFINTTFGEKGEIDFSRAKFHDDVTFFETMFKGKKSNFDETQFDKNTYFRETQFSGEAHFLGSQFSGKADFGRAQFLENANYSLTKFLGFADFGEAKFSRDVGFTGAQFFDNASFNLFRFCGKVCFREAKFYKRAEFQRNCYEDEDVNNLSFEYTYFFNIRGLFEYVEENKEKFERSNKTEFLPDNFRLILGEEATARYPIISREIRDDMYLLDKKERISKKVGIRKLTAKTLYYLWWLFADYGRSVFKWAAWSFGFAIGFAAVFYLYFLESPSSFQTVYISEVFPPFSFLYYSVVTFTTLGFGDIVPKCGWLQLWVMLEVILGYIMLGGLISIFSNKLARRS